MPPPADYPFTVTDLVATQDPARFKQVEREYADGVWRAWSAHHATIRGWLDDLTTLPKKT